MAASVTINLAGFKTAEPMIRRLVADALFETASKVDADAKRLVPVDTGRLKTSIHVEQGPGRGPLDEPLPTELDALVGTNVEYAAAIEYGFTGPVTVRQHTRRTKYGTVTVRAHSRVLRVRKRPYLRPAYHKNRKELKRRIEAKLRAL